ncbi:MAG: hypothetical protein LBI80_03565 [Endomicrobium sp.]|jgi:hypothetical protein|nr:hypothetical protein [Endomicrobium sp.]
MKPRSERRRGRMIEQQASTKQLGNLQERLIELMYDEEILVGQIFSTSIWLSS